MCYLYIYRKINNRVGICHKIDEKFYAFDDTCGNMNALLSSDNIVTDNIVTCLFRRIRFDITTGAKIKDPILTPSQENETTTKNMAKVLQYAGQLMAHIKTYDQEIYETIIEGDSIKIKI